MTGLQPYKFSTDLSNRYASLIDTFGTGGKAFYKGEGNGAEFVHSWLSTSGTLAVTGWHCSNSLFRLGLSYLQQLYCLPFQAKKRPNRVIPLCEGFDILFGTMPSLLLLTYPATA
ncbi:hypothetical protein [Snodgrassella gandavensis]|uniref:hypothetical protein n=1 Tax=Snodgrassella gandavensis TaxID=2946698 RepID=UPI001EF4EB5B|nr:hypothetical protein [Snodgrassella gandavensis]